MCLETLSAISISRGIALLTILTTFSATNFASKTVISGLKVTKEIALMSKAQPSLNCEKMADSLIKHAAFCVALDFCGYYSSCFIAWSLIVSIGFWISFSNIVFIFPYSLIFSKDETPSALSVKSLRLSIMHLRLLKFISRRRNVISLKAFVPLPSSLPSPNLNICYKSSSEKRPWATCFKLIYRLRSLREKTGYERKFSSSSSDLCPSKDGKASLLKMISNLACWSEAILALELTKLLKLASKCYYDASMSCKSENLDSSIFIS